MRITNDPKDKTYKFRVPESLASKIDSESKRKGITVSEFLRRAVEEYLKEGKQ